METICFEDTKQGSIFYSVKSIRISNFLIAHSGGLAGKHIASHTGDWGLIPSGTDLSWKQVRVSRVLRDDPIKGCPVSK